MEFYPKETYQIALEVAFKTWVWHRSDEIESDKD